MKRSPSFWLPAAAIFLLSAIALTTSPADTVTLKTGETYTGDITYEDDQHIVLKVPVSAGITDERRIMRSDIERIEKISPADVEFKQIESLKPGSTSVALETYDEYINRLEQYQKAYPESQFNQVVSDRIAAFKAEKDRVAGGEIKIDGEWITKAEAEERRYQLSAQLLFDGMKQAVQKGDYIAALNTFDKIAKDYPGSEAYVEAVPAAQEVLSTLSLDLTRRKQALERALQIREQKLAITSEPEKSKLIAAKKREDAQYDAVIAAALKSGIKWPPIIPQSMDSLKKIEALIPAAQRQLAQIKLDSMKASILNLKAAKQLIKDGQLEGAATKLQEAKKLWANYEEIGRWEQKLKLAEEEAKRRAAAAAATPAGAEQGKEVKPAATAAETASTSSPVAAAEVEVEEVAIEAEGKTTPGSHTETSELPFFLTIPGAASILGGVILFVILLSILGRLQRSKEKEEDEEQEDSES